MTVARGVAVTLAVWRLTELMTADEITRPLREAAARRSDRLGYLTGCRACMSVWAGLAVASARLPKTVEGALVASAGTLLLDRAVEIVETAVSASARRR